MRGRRLGEVVEHEVFVSDRQFASRYLHCYVENQLFDRFIGKHGVTGFILLRVEATQ
jgi:hypothetical protein